MNPQQLLGNGLQSSSSISSLNLALKEDDDRNEDALEIYLEESLFIQSMGIFMAADGCLEGTVKTVGEDSSRLSGRSSRLLGSCIAEEKGVEDGRLFS